MATASRTSFGLALGLALAACGGEVTSSDELVSSSSRAEPSREDVARSKTASSKKKESSKAVLLAKGLRDVTALAQDSTHVFVSTETTTIGDEDTPRGGLFVVDKSGSEPLLLAADGRGFAFVAVAVTRGKAFVATADGRIIQISTRGGDARLLLEEPSEVLSLVADSEHVYAAYASGVVVQISPKDDTVVTFTAEGSPVTFHEAGATEKVTISDSRFHYFVQGSSLYRQSI